MKQVNGYDISTAIGPLAAVSDEEALSLRKLSAANLEKAAREMIRVHVRQAFHLYDEPSRNRIKTSLRYFLTVPTPPSTWEKIYESSLPPVDLPPNPQQFFVWLWEELFPGEDFHVEDPSSFEVHNEFETWRYLRASPAGGG